MHRIRGVVLLVVAAWVLPAAGGASADEAGPVDWRSGAGGAFEAAADSGRPVLADLWAVWCVPCREMDETTYRDPRVVKAIDGFVALKVDVDAEAGFARRYQADSFPTTLFLDGQGREIGRRLGLVTADDLLVALNQVHAGYDAYLENVERTDDPEALRALADYLLGAGNAGSALKHLKTARKLIPDDDAAAVQEIELLMAEAVFMDGRAAPAAKELRRLADEAVDSSLLGRALAGLIRVERSRGRDKKILDALETLRRDYPELAADLDAGAE